MWASGRWGEGGGAGGGAKQDSVPQAGVSRSTACLTEIGVLKGEGKKLITRRGRSLALALAHKDGAGIKDNWRAIVAASEFLQNVVSAVKLREGMLYPTVQAYIAHAAGQPRNKPVMNGAGAIIEILKASGMLREEAGELVATFDERPEVLIPEEDPPAQTFETRESVVTVGEVNGTPAGTSPTVSIHVQIRCTAEEIDDLAPRLKSLLRELSTEP